VAEAEGDGEGGRAGVPCDIRVLVGRGLARHQPLGRHRPAAQQGGGLPAARTRREVEGDEVATRLEGGGDARLMFPVKHRQARRGASDVSRETVGHVSRETSAYLPMTAWTRSR